MHEWMVLGFARYGWSVPVFTVCWQLGYYGVESNKGQATHVRFLLQGLTGEIARGYGSIVA